MKVRLRYLCELNPPSNKLAGLSSETEVAFVPMEAVREGHLEPVSRPLSAVASGYTRFQEGDVLLPKIAPTFGHGRVVVAADLPHGVGFGTTELHVLRPRRGVDPHWLRYVLLEPRFVSEGQATYYGVAGQQRISTRWLKDYSISVPALADQRRIAQHLDLATASMAELNREANALVALMRERQRIVQSELAVRGLEKAPRKDSGQPWLGSVPSHWQVLRLKYVARLASGHTPSKSRAELWEDCTIPWISLNDVGSMGSSEYLEETINLISEAGIAASSARVLPAGTVVLSRDATIGKAAIMRVPMATSQHFANWVCDTERLCPRYLWLLFHEAMQPYFESLTDGATLRTIGMGDLREFTIPLPPLAEQVDIVNAAEKERRLAHEAELELLHQLELLAERRGALISATLTNLLEKAA